MKIYDMHIHAEGPEINQSHLLCEKNIEKILKNPMVYAIISTYVYICLDTFIL